MIRLALGDGQGQNHADGRHQYRSDDEHRTPAEVVGYYAGYRSSQQNPQQQTTHDTADHAAARFFGRQMSGQWNQDLYRHRAEPHQQRDEQKHVRLVGERRAQQTGNRHHGGDDHQTAVFQQITQRHQKEQA
ncbi:hypothetical protein ABH909_004721 [Pseudomonas sp. BS3782 TE3695]